MATHTSQHPSFATPTPTHSPACITAIPGRYGYVPPDACNAQWAYAPSFTAAIAFSVLFGILATAHLALAFYFRKGFCWVMIMGASWEFAAFILRAFGAHDQQSQTFSVASTLLFLLAPLWINAYVYMTAGRLIWTYHADKRVWCFKAISLGKYFVWLDVLSFLVQAVGGIMLSPGGSESTMKVGKNIYMSGVGIQQLFIFLFFTLIVRFQIEVQRTRSTETNQCDKLWRWVTYALYATLALVTMRIIFRLLEFSAGTGTENPLPYHEKYALALDAFPMTLALLILAIVHPGLALKGPESEFPSRRDRKTERKKAKAAKKAEKKWRGMKNRNEHSDISCLHSTSV